MRKDFYTPSEVAQILGVPHRRVRERLAAVEIEAEVDPCTDRWKIPKSSLNGSEATRPIEAEAGWQGAKALHLAELHRERVWANRERKRANREQEKAAWERERAEGLQRKLKAERSKRVRRRLFGG